MTRPSWTLCPDCTVMVRRLPRRSPSNARITGRSFHTANQFFCMTCAIWWGMFIRGRPQGRRLRSPQGINIGAQGFTAGASQSAPRDTHRGRAARPFALVCNAFGVPIVSLTGKHSRAQGRRGRIQGAPRDTHLGCASRPFALVCNAFGVPVVSAPFPFLRDVLALAGLCQTASELSGRGPRPAGLRVGGGGENLLIFLAFVFRPGFDQHDQLAARDTVSQLQAMGGQLVTRRLPFLARPGRQEFQFFMCQRHGVLSSTYRYS